MWRQSYYIKDQHGALAKNVNDSNSLSDIVGVQKCSSLLEPYRLGFCDCFDHFDSSVLLSLPDLPVLQRDEEQSRAFGIDDRWAGKPEEYSSSHRER